MLPLTLGATKLPNNAIVARKAKSTTQNNNKQHNQNKC